MSGPWNGRPWLTPAERVKECMEFLRLYFWAAVVPWCIFMFILSLLLGGCAQQPRRVVVRSFCELASPINPPKALIDEWKQDVHHQHVPADEIANFLRQIRAHNDTGRAVCGWTQ